MVHGGWCRSVGAEIGFVGPPCPGRWPRCYTQVVDPIGLVPIVKEMDELRPAKQTQRPPRACHVGEGDSSANCGNSRKPDNLIHHPDKPDGVSRDVAFMLAHLTHHPRKVDGDSTELCVITRAGAFGYSLTPLACWYPLHSYRFLGSGANSYPTGPVRRGGPGRPSRKRP